MTRLYGRARRGERVKGAAPFGHWKTMSCKRMDVIGQFG